ncbi:MAG: alpha/beta hydrolase [Ferroplasma sp.]|uniref:alpha/beta hydrolase n=1 Tax=Ferroplasma sp. TaxID=2591003 RepID=UPI002815698C|nr:alpha/beta hydrolase [Ferroplasma sp.]WMT51133.1 MAG: alpha/beta hydrolase [Ferroplasma sp.]
MVDPDFKTLIEMSRNAGDMTEMEPATLRNFLNETSINSQGKKIDVKEIRDYRIELKERTLKARMYSNVRSESALVYYHGGGFLFGDIETYDNFCRFLAYESGVKIISVEYRLAPENKFPDAINDAYDSFHYICENKDKFGITGKLGVGGDSAGANLSAALCLKSRDMKTDMPAAQILFYPSLAPDNFSRSFMEYGNDYVLTEKMIRYFGYLYSRSMEDLINPYFSPLVADDLTGLPPAIVISNEYDPLRDPEESYVKKLRQAGISALGIRGIGMIHGSATDFEISEGARMLVKMVARVIPDYL